MSVIHDALKKVEKSIAQGQNLPLPPCPEKSRRKSKIPYFLIVLLIIPAAAVFLFMMPRANTPLLPLKELRKQPGKIAPAIPPPKTVAQEKPNPLGLILNGVFFSKDQGYALINNQIAKENDLIKGAKVVRIGMEDVELQRGDETITLSTANK